MDRRRQRYNQLQAKRSRNRSHSKELFPLPVKKLVPTFKEFVSFVLDEAREGNELDMHWTPVYSFCNPCQVRRLCDSIITESDIDTDVEILQSFVILRC